MSNPILPGAGTPEGMERIARAVDARADVDFRAFRLLQDLWESGVLTHTALVEAYVERGVSAGDAHLDARETLEEIEEVISDRREADRRVIGALSGREVTP